jgi:hypothetical protein
MGEDFLFPSVKRHDLLLMGPKREENLKGKELPYPVGLVFPFTVLFAQIVIL